MLGSNVGCVEQMALHLASSFSARLRLLSLS